MGKSTSLHSIAILTCALAFAAPARAAQCGGDFNTFISAIGREAAAAGISRPVIDSAFGGLAADAGLSVRALEGCWLRHRDVRPGHDVGRVRLGRAHRDLEFYRPGETTGNAVARSWGFRPQPFVAAYGARFGRYPVDPTVVFVRKD